MVKLTVTLAALVIGSLAGTRASAQTEQTASVEIAPVALIETAAPVNASEQLASVSIPDAPVADANVTQLAMTDAPAAPATELATGPSLAAATLSPKYASSKSVAANSMRRPSRGSGVGLMILGGAALVTGLIIGDDAGTVIAVAGAVVGLYGLYVYLGRPTGMDHSSRIGLGYKLNTN